MEENLGKSNSGPSKVVQYPNLREYKYQTVVLSITSAAANATTPAQVSESIELDKQYKRCIGVAIDFIESGASAPNTNHLKIGKLEIQNREVYSPGLFVKPLTHSNDVPFNKKFDKRINEEASGNKVNILLEEYNTGTFVAYKVAVTFLLSNRAEDAGEIK